MVRGTWTVGSSNWNQWLWRFNRTITRLLYSLWLHRGRALGRSDYGFRVGQLRNCLPWRYDKVRTSISQATGKEKRARLIGFSSSCVSLCTVCIMTELQPTSTTPCNLWIIERCNLVFALKTHKTIMFHEFAPNLVNVHFPTQEQSFGTIYPCTSVLNQTLRVSRTFLLKTYFFRLAFDLLG